MSSTPPPDDSYRAEPLPSYPAGAGDQSPYGTGNQPGAGVPQPPSIQMAVRLMWVGAGLSVVSLIVTLLTLSSLKSHIQDQLAKSNPTLSTSDINTTYHTVVAGAVVGAIVGVALWLWMAWKNGQGRSWARVVATVLGAINLLSSIYTVAVGHSLAVSVILTVLDLVLAIVILVLLWRRESSEFYAARSAH
jgi:sterol desaturase/sphingolipid hydroxylase (fatty acid hydroxylase superfamily)